MMEATSHLIDFRVRPPTKEWMSMYTDTPGVSRWKDRGYEAVPLESLEAFADALSANDVSTAVIAGRKSWLGRLSNEYVSQCVSQFPEQFAGLAGIDPLGSIPVRRQLEYALDELGLIGIALDPPDPVHGMSSVRGYDDAEVMFPLYEIAEERSVLVMLTLGPMVGRADDPWAVDNVAASFPDLTLVCSHAVWPRTLEWVAVAEQNANVYLETSIYFGKPGCEPLYSAVEGSLAKKVIYASSFPFRRLDVHTELDRLGLSEKARRNILCDNGSYLLRRHGHDRNGR